MRSVISRRSVSRLALLLLLGGCSAADLDQRYDRAAEIAMAWQPVTLEGEPFRLAAWLGPRESSPTLILYMEGDGFAFATRTRPSFNPTPRHPLTLQLALREAKGSVAYLARPCQYLDLEEEPACNAKVWTRDRYGNKVIDASDAAVSELKERYGVEQLILVGYSGGGAVAALVAARRTDVVKLVTIAAPLDHAYWTASDNLAPLTGSLNPADEWQALADLPQTHFVGTDDDVVSVDVLEAYRVRFPETSPVRVVPVEGFDHRCCWVDAWPDLANGVTQPVD